MICATNITEAGGWIRGCGIRSTAEKILGGSF